MSMLTQRRGFYFIIFLGIVSLFADMTYEGARSITGPYLAQLGATATLVGFVAGFGELIGYSIRLFSGKLADRTQRYWLITIVGYAINLFSVPLLAFTHHWATAAILIVIERLGKSIRVPARDAMLSYGSHSLGMGFGFGLHEALDQIGAMLGPLVVAVVLLIHHSYRLGFAILAIPAFLALISLLIAYKKFPFPQRLEVKQDAIEKYAAPQTFWIYLIGAACVAMGYADFPLIAFHFEKANIIGSVWIPITYGIAMGIDAFTSPLLGWLYDKFGLTILIVVILFSASFAPMVFLGGNIFAFIGVAIWAIGMGAQSSLMRSTIGKMIPPKKRGTAYGIFNLFYGVSWFIGSLLLGIIYDHSIPFTAAFVVIFQLAAIPWFLVVRYRMKHIHQH